MTAYYQLTERKHFVVGMLWHPIEEGANKKDIQLAVDKTAQIYHLNTNHQPTIGCFTNTNNLTKQIGLCEESGYLAPKKSKLFPLAVLAALANKSMTNFVGRLALDAKSHWIIVFRAGIILPSGDRIVPSDRSSDELDKITTENKSLEIAFDCVDTSESKLLVESWFNQQGKFSTELPAVVPINDVGSTTKTRKNTFMAIGAIVLIGVISSIGYNQYENYKHAKIKEEKLQEERLRELLARSQEKQVPWEAWPSFNYVYNSCIEIYKERKKNVNGWDLTNWYCGAQQVTETWQRSSIGSFTLPPVGDGEINVQDPNMITYTIPMPKFPARGKSAINYKNSAGKYLMDLARLNDSSIDISWGNEVTRSIPTGDTFVKEGLGYAENTASLRFAALPSAKVIYGLSNIAAIELSEIKKEGNSWELTANFYTTFEGKS
jgi:hypothetical protein